MGRKWLVFWSILYGVGAPLFQVGFILKHRFLNQFSLADFVIGSAMLVSVWGLWRERPWARLLNPIAWGAFLALFCECPELLCFFPQGRHPRRRGL